jgi:prevent-host-death family protein
MIQVPLNELKDHLAEYIARASDEQVLITEDGRPAAVMIGFADEDDWFEYRLLNDPRFKARIAESRRQAAAGETVKLEDLPE